MVKEKRANFYHILYCYKHTEDLQNSRLKLLEALADHNLIVLTVLLP